MSRADLLRRASAINDSIASPEIRAHALVLKEKYVAAARIFIALAIHDAEDRDVFLQQASGAISKAGKSRSALRDEVMAAVPKLIESRYLLEIVLKTAGPAGMEMLNHSGSLPPQLQRQLAREQLLAATRLLSSPKPTASTIAYIRRVVELGLHRSRSPDDLPFLMDASIKISSRLYAMLNSDDENVREAGSKLRAIVESKKIPSPDVIYTRMTAGKDLSSRLRPARQLNKVKSVFSTVYDQHAVIKDDIVQSLVEGALRSSTNIRSTGLLSAITNASRTVRFWEDSDHRADLCNRALNGIEGLKDEKATLLRARLAMACGDLHEYERQIAVLKEMDLRSEEGGYLTYINLKADEHPATIEPPEVVELVPRSSRDQARAIAAACADMGYFRRYARAFVTSHRNVATGVMPHIHVMASPEDRDELVRFASAFPGLSISTEIPAINAPFYYATNRFLQIENITRVVGQPVVLVDIDVAFMADVHEPLEKHGIAPDIMFRINDKVRIFDHSNTRQLSFDYPRLDAWGIVPAGYLYAAPTRTGLLAAHLVAEEAGRFLGKYQATGRTNWWIDQNVLFKALYRVRTELPGADVKNVADYGLPYGWRRPEGSRLRKPMGHHPMLTALFPEPSWLSAAIRSVAKKLMPRMYERGMNVDAFRGKPAVSLSHERIHPGTSS